MSMYFKVLFHNIGYGAEHGMQCILNDANYSRCTRAEYKTEFVNSKPYKIEEDPTASHRQKAPARQ
jgi:hypothetical protein